MRPMYRDNLVDALQVLAAAMSRKPFWCCEPQIRITARGYEACYRDGRGERGTGVFADAEEALEALQGMVAEWQREAAEEAVTGERRSDELPPSNPAPVRSAPKRKAVADRRQANLLLPLAGGGAPAEEPAESAGGPRRERSSA